MYVPVRVRYMERDPVRGKDSFAAFEEVLLLAKQKKVHTYFEYIIFCLFVFVVLSYSVCDDESFMTSCLVLVHTSLFVLPKPILHQYLLCYISRVVRYLHQPYGIKPKMYHLAPN